MIERALRLQRGLRCIRRIGERHAERITDHFEDLAVALHDRALQQGVMTLERTSHQGRMFLDEASRPLDIGEQKGDCGLGRMVHACVAPSGRSTLCAGSAAVKRTTDIVDR